MTEGKRARPRPVKRPPAGAVPPDPAKPVGVIRLATREQMFENHRLFAARFGTPETAAVGLRPRNVEQVLDLGNVIYFTFRGRVFGIPPVGWREGQELHLLWTDARAIVDPLEPDSARQYYAHIAELPRLLWRLSFRGGKYEKVWKWLRRFGLARNPYRQASEAELVELASFFLARRLTSSISDQPAMAPLARSMRSTPSPISAIGSRRGSTRGASR